MLSRLFFCFIVVGGSALFILYVTMFHQIVGYIFNWLFGSKFLLVRLMWYLSLANSVKAWRIVGTTVLSRYWRTGMVFKSLLAYILFDWVRLLALLDRLRLYKIYKNLCGKSIKSQKYQSTNCIFLISYL